MNSRINSRFGDCNSPGYSCDTGYGPEDEVEPAVTIPSTPPELTEDYLEAQRKAEEAVKMMEESLSLFEGLYWDILWENVSTSLILWSTWLKDKLIVLGVELLACFVTGSVVLAMLCVILGCFGPLRIKWLASLIIAFIIGSTFAWGSIEVATTSIIGVVLWMFIFLSNTTNEVVKKETGGGARELSTVLNCKFWYIGSRTLSINLSEGLIGVMSDD
ncbi:unnamed protein product [Orchesella dallaii]|uniref:Transmembrane protein n=1 Tax=Orchesella dallaii TaxID=48710 RepID=A0ABP1QSH5_9HEXA